MVSKKRVKKGIDSIEKQLELHEQKIVEEKSHPNARPWLIDYWTGEIMRLRKRAEDREKKLSRKHGK